MRVAVNGFGRIGRVFSRLLADREDIQLVAINDLMDEDNMFHLMKYDSIHGKIKTSISSTPGTLGFGKQSPKLFHETDPEKLPWADLEVDVVIESTGRFRTQELASKHITAGAKRVIISAPASSQEVPTIVIGINEDKLDPKDLIISNASCTTNSAAPMVKIIDDHFGIDQGFITTVHSYTGDQRLHDSPHKDLRRARAGALSIVPTTTGAAKAITKIFPHLEGHMGGCGIRVPVPNGSLTDITFVVNKETSTEEVNELFAKYAETSMKGILEISNEPLVSIDIVGTTASCIFDAELTSVMGKMVKIVGWYDNESGYSNRLVDLILKLRSLT